MNLLDLELLPLTLLFIVPGFVAMKAYSLFVPSEPTNWSESLVEVFAYGALNFGIWSWALDWLFSRAGEHPIALRVGLPIFLFVTPVALAAGANALLKWDRLRRFVIHPTPTGWDHFFGKGKPCFILLHLKSGGFVGGLFDSDSLASSFPRSPDVYLQQVWKVDERGRFLEPIAGSAGMYVRMDDCNLVEFFVLAEKSQSSSELTPGEPFDIGPEVAVYEVSLGDPLKQALGEGEENIPEKEDNGP